MGLRDVRYFLRGRLNRGMSRLLTRRAGPPPVFTPAPLEAVLAGPRTPLALTRLLESRDNAAREAALARYLAARGVPFARHRFATFEGQGENFAVDLGAGDRVLVLAAHHDAVPGSPGANDNAASVAILLTLLERLAASPLAGVRVRLLFPACEELGYLGARAYVRETPLAGVVGVLSLELCGIGDTLAVWDAGDDTPFLRTLRGAFESLGRRADESYHVVGRIPVFGSDHRAFTAAGVPGYGLTVVPVAEAEALRQFVFSPVRSAISAVARRPVPFDTYHTRRDTLATLDGAALEMVVGALEAVVAAAA
ncbi:MAG TPA: M28 family metallopeptidase [Methylomirabilota bacterium]|nr:M28 family metallopeptidase [Methylomirabilota bacterium]